MTAAVLFGTGAYMLLSRDLLRVVIGVAAISQSAVLTLILPFGPALQLIEFGRDLVL